MDDIAREAGVAKGTLYLYFPSKEELFVSLIEQRIRDYLSVYLENLKRATSVEAVIALLVRARIQFSINHGSLLVNMFQVMTMDSVDFQKRLYRAKSDAHKPFIQAFERLRSGLGVSADSHSLVTMIAGMTDYLIGESVYGGQPLQLEDAERIVMEFVRHGLGTG